MMIEIGMILVFLVGAMRAMGFWDGLVRIVCFGDMVVEEGGRGWRIEVLRNWDEGSLL